MGTKDPRIDAYIAKSADFAKPILTHLREVVHAACTDVEETMKWSAPHFDYKGEMMCGMAAFKEHCAFGFWKGSLILGENSRSGEGMGHRLCAFALCPPQAGEDRRRLETAIGWIAEGKSRHWKYK